MYITLLNRYTCEGFRKNRKPHFLPFANGNSLVTSVGIIHKAIAQRAEKAGGHLLGGCFLWKAIDLGVCCRAKAGDPHTPLEGLGYAFN